MPATEPPISTRTEIACAAARLIAEEGMDYASAKRKAARALLGDESPGRGLLPDNQEVEAELRSYLALYAAEAQPRRLGALRSLALLLMQRLIAFDPHLTGAVLNGTATEHSDIHLSLYVDSAKDVELFLLNQGVEFDVEQPNGEAAAIETLQFVVTPARTQGMPARVGVVLDILERAGLRVAPRWRSNHPGLHPVEAAGRANAAQVTSLLRELHPDLAP